MQNGGGGGGGLAIVQQQQQPQQQQQTAVCSAQVVTLSVKELRMKGSSFLRTHASKHGITNASRKLTSQVIQELIKHYTLVHKVTMQKDDFINQNSSQTPHQQPAPILQQQQQQQVVKTVVQQLTANDKNNVPKHGHANAPVIIVPPPAHCGSAVTSAAVVAANNSLANHTIHVISNGHDDKEPPVISISENSNTLTFQLPQHPLPLVQQQQPQLQRPAQQPIKVHLPTKPVPMVMTQQQQQPPPLATARKSAPAPIPKAATKGPPVAKVPPTQLTTITVPTIQVPSNVILAPTANNVRRVINVGEPQHQVQGGGQCNASVMAKSRVELASCGTSQLRPEAAAHKVHNASRKPKDKVVDELWQHYLSQHGKDLQLSGLVVSPRRQQQQQMKTVSVTGGANGAVVGAGSSSRKATVLAASSGGVNNTRSGGGGCLGSVVDEEEEENASVATTTASTPSTATVAAASVATKRTSK